MSITAANCPSPADASLRGPGDPMDLARWAGLGPFRERGLDEAGKVRLDADGSRLFRWNAKDPNSMPCKLTNLPEVFFHAIERGNTDRALPYISSSRWRTTSELICSRSVSMMIFTTWCASCRDRRI
jgi:hypothetical protein